MKDPVFKSPEAAEIVERLYRETLERWPVARQELQIATRQGTTFVVVSGPEDAPPVLLFHGSQANSASWIPDVKLWSARFRLYAVDMIGEPGLSARVRPDLRDESHADWLDDVLDGLGLARAAIVGTSLGGWLALDYACRRPDRVNALALLCPAGIGRQKNFMLKALPLLLLGPWGRRKMMELVFGPTPEVMPHELMPIAELMSTIGTSVNPRFVTIPQFSDVQLQRLSMPLLAIVGGRDALLDSRDTRERLRRNVPGAEVVFLQDGYHFLPDQAPRILGFLAKAAGETTSGYGPSPDSQMPEACRIRSPATSVATEASGGRLSADRKG